VTALETWTTRTLAWVRTPRGIALGVYAVALLAFCIARGIPLERNIQMLWILLGIFAATWGDPWQQQLKVLTYWLPFLAFFLVYDYTRGIADKLGMPVHVTQPLAWETWLFHGVVPTQWLQDHFYVPDQVKWYDVVVSLVYFSHFIVVWVFAAVIWVRNRRYWFPWARRLLILSYAGLLTYIVYPAAPPWYAAQQGLIPDVQRIATRGWDALGLHQAGALIEKGQAQSNLVAAIPSLHAAFTAMLCVFVWGVLGRVGRTLMVLYTGAMALSLVYGGEHYVVDALIGYGYVAVVAVGVALLERRFGWVGVMRKRAPEPVPEPARAGTAP
jgi:hypothetical protein